MALGINTSMDIKNIISAIDYFAKDDDNIVFLHDSFDLELNEHFVIETGVVGFTEDGIILEADDETIEFLELNDMLTEGSIPQKPKPYNSNPVAKHMHKYNKPATQIDKKKEAKKTGEFKPIDLSEGKQSAFEVMRDIVANQQAQKIEGVMVDMFTASVITQAYDKVSDNNKKKIEDASLERLIGIAQKIMGRQELEEIKKLANLDENPNPGDFNQAVASPIGSINRDDEERVADANITGKNPYVVSEAEYQGRNVTLNKPMQGDVKKSKVYVKNAEGNVVKVNFGAKGMSIKKNNPERRKSFRARHNCKNPGPKWKARYWSCRAW